MGDRLLALTLPDKTTIETPPGFLPTGGGIEDIIQWVLQILFVLAIILTLIFLLWGGVKWITSGGDKEKIESARKTIIFSIIGLIVVLLSVAIVHFVGIFVGVELFYSTPDTNSGGQCIGSSCLIE